MARIYQPKQRHRDKRWDMTASSDEEGWTHPIGYCAGWHEWTEERAKRIGFSLEHCLRDQEPRLPHKAKFHEDGHATSEEASACWDGYVLDTELSFREEPEQKRKCQVCGEWTQTVAVLGHEFHHEFYLCTEHATREHVEARRNFERDDRRARRGT
jgi:hypothetical protein